MTAEKRDGAALTDDQQGRLYLSLQVAGLTKADAQTVCRNLKAKRTDCLVLKIDNPLAMGN